MADQRDWRIPSWRYPPNRLFDLSGRTALVTGAASGLGRAIALGLDAHGAQVVVADRDRAGANTVRAELQHDSATLPVDVTDSTAVQALVHEAVELFGRIDIAFVLPGINVRKPALEISDEEWNRVVELNLSSTFTTAREIGRAMVTQGQGSMILMASARGLTGGRSQSVYSATKAGIIGLMRCLAWEWAPHVRVNALAPGYMATPLVAPMVADAERWRATEALHALGRAGDPEEIVGPAVFLASDASSFVTGTVLTVDGGWTAGAA
jgi:gluconate 5-dehydrogenase